MRTPLRAAIATGTALAAAAFLAAGAAAQQVSVRISEQGAPAQGVLILLLDADGNTHARGLSAADGRLVLRAAAGRYRIRAELIGRRPTETDFFELASEQALEREIALETEPVMLDGITAEVGQLCEVRPMPGRDVHTVWDEARKALEAEQIGREAALYRFDIEHFVREVEPRSRRVVADQRNALSNLTTNPFRTRPAAELVEDGYFRNTPDGDILYAPAPDVLLSDEFLDTHCFRLVRNERAEPGAIGLSFEPVPGRKQNDVAGVLWLDDETAHLRRLEFRYVQLPTRLPTGPYGGEATFRRLPSGVWVVQQWTIRAPIVAVQVGAQFHGEERLVGLQEEGAEVVRIADREGSVIADANRATLAGVIHDGREGRPLPGATVTLEGSAYSTTTDAGGRFRLAGVPEGEYRLAWTHPRIANTGYVPETRDVRLVAGETLELSFLLPRNVELTLTAEEAARADSIQSITRALGSNIIDTRSRADAPAGEPARVHGRVLDHETGRALSGVHVTVRGSDVAATTSARGMFVLPGVPPGERVIEASLIGYGSREERVVLEPGAAVDLELRLATRAIELPAITVEARSRWLAIQGVYERRDGGLSGNFIMRAEIERRSEPAVSQLLSNVAGVRIHSLGAGRRHLRFNRQVGMSRGGLDGCEPQIYLDGLRYNAMNTSIPSVNVDNIDFLSSAEIEAIEVYVGNPPLQYPHPCGVVLIWTRRGG